jgi:hypothetical protein
MAGGGAPDTALAVLLTTLVAWAGTSVANRRQTTLSVLTALGMAQLAMHLVLNFVIPEHIGHHAAPVNAPAMWTTHIAATLLTGLLLAKADTALHVVASAITLLKGLLKPPTFPRVAAAAYVLPASPKHTNHILHMVLRKVHARRGPPLTS